MANSVTRLLICVSLIVLTTAAFWQVKNNDFINYDDDVYVYQNKFIEDGLNYKSIIWAFSTTHNNNWHPLTWLSHLLDCQFYGITPAGHHVTSLLLHLANVVLLFLVWQRMTGALWPSAMLAALFALHPLHVESVAWVAERKDVLSTFFWFLTLGAYVRYTQRPALVRYLLILLFFALGLMSKPMLVTLPFVLLLLDYWPLRRWPLTQETARKVAPGQRAALPLPRVRPGFRLVVEKAPFFILTGLSCLITLKAQQSAMVHSSIGSRMANSLVAYVRYIGMAIWPSQLAFFYPQAEGLPWWQVVGAALLLLGISALVIREARQRPYLPVGWFWFLGTLVPVIGLVQVGEQALADRYTYVPLIGLFILGVWGTLDLSARWRHRRPFLAVAAGMVISLAAVLTWQQAGYWRNSEALSQHAIKVTANNYIAYDNLGVAYGNKGNFDEAIEMFKKAIKMNPDMDTFHCNLGRAYEEKGWLDEAAAEYERAIAINHSNKKAYKKLIAIYEKQGNIDNVIMILQQAIELNPDFVEAYNKLGLIYGNQGRLEEAIALFQEAIRLQPDSAVPYYNLGRAYLYLARNEEAIAMLQKAVQIKPDFSAARDMLKKLTEQ